MLEPRAPWWMPQPHPDESFADFWERMGFTAYAIAGALDVYNPGAAEVANERLAQRYADRNPRSFRRAREAFIAARGNVRGLRDYAA